MDIKIRLTTMEDQHIIALSQRQHDEILAINPDLLPFTTNIPFLVVLERRGEAIACGGLRPLHSQSGKVGEMKRVYVVPEARGKSNGISDFLARQLESFALQKGWTKLRLQTSKDMPAANKFYERLGYCLIPNYGEYVGCPYTISYEKALV